VLRRGRHKFSGFATATLEQVQGMLKDADSGHLIHYLTVVSRRQASRAKIPVCFDCAEPLIDEPNLAP
jgi:hypothetical protein